MTPLIHVAILHVSLSTTTPLYLDRNFPLRYQLWTLSQKLCKFLPLQDLHVHANMLLNACAEKNTNSFTKGCLHVKYHFVAITVITMLMDEVDVISGMTNTRASGISQSQSQLKG